MLDIVGALNEYSEEMEISFEDVWTDFSKQYVSFDLLGRKFEAMAFNGKYHIHEVIYDTRGEVWLYERNYDTREEFVDALHEVVYIHLTAKTHRDGRFWVIEVPELGMWTQAYSEDTIEEMACDLASAVYDKPISLFKATVIYTEEGN